ncbi:MAG: HEAT repeat domain-containing protein [Persicimonas sp.]
MLDEDIHDDAGARRMLDILTDPEADDELRAQAAIKLGPGLQLCDERIDWEDITLYFGKAAFEEIDQTFRRLYHDASTPKLVRRRILEAAVRAPMDWHEGAVRAALETDDDDWRQTAVFGMGNIPGFEDQLLDIVQRDDLSEGVLREAVRAAGARELDKAEPIVRRVALDESRESYTRQLAIEALIWCGNDRSERALEKLKRHSDSDIAEVAEWALGEFRMFRRLPDDLMGFDDDLF